ncbi:hypothetical protein G5I_01889 [Acromyrmex echinatior]|uniref:Uncharacterized protein n=1 Tax=Acromyrmex echinatior TaxID=103372 RepID=F4W8V4_ACREC|nr:hypothetical protein G5I_01889 [Acromyrmex echinatior]
MYFADDSRSAKGSRTLLISADRCRFHSYCLPVKIAKQDRNNTSGSNNPYSALCPSKRNVHNHRIPTKKPHGVFWQQLGGGDQELPAVCIRPSPWLWHLQHHCPRPIFAAFTAGVSEPCGLDELDLGQRWGGVRETQSSWLPPAVIPPLPSPHPHILQCFGAPAGSQLHKRLRKAVELGLDESSESMEGRNDQSASKRTMSNIGAEIKRDTLLKEQFKQRLLRDLNLSVSGLKVVLRERLRAALQKDSNDESDEDDGEAI